MNNRLKAVLDRATEAAQPPKYYVIGASTVYGPFKDQLAAEHWAAERPSLGPCNLWSFFPPLGGEGTYEKAHECGTLLKPVRFY